MTKDDLHNKKLLNILRAVAIVAIVGISVFLWFNLKSLTVSEIINYTPDNLLLAVALLLLYYALKSFVVVIPVLVVQIAAGMIFSMPVAIAVNLVGLVITLSISFFLGKYTGHSYVEKLIKRYPKSAVIQTLPQKNEFLFCFLIHSLCVFPMNMIGMFVGSINIRYGKYFLGAFFGSLIRVVSVTVMGSSVTEPSSPIFIISTIITVVVSLCSYLLYKRRVSKMQSDDNHYSSDDSSK